MKKFFILIAVAVLGFAVALGGVYINDTVSSGNTEPIPRIQLPFNSFIAGTGMLVSSSKNIVIGSLISGVITKIAVKNAQKIKKGALLFVLDDSIVKNEIALLQTQKTVLLAEEEAKKHQFELIKEFKKVSPTMVSSEKFIAKRDAYRVAQTLHKVLVQKIKILQKKKEFYRVYAPIDGTILHCTLSVGSYFDKNSPHNALVIGSNSMSIDVSINEYDIEKFQKNSPAIAFVRGSQKHQIKLKYRYTIPFVTPKRAFTGRSTEKTDTRVLHTIYAIPKESAEKLYVGQQLDVFIQVKR